HVTHYELLGVDEGAGTKEIKTAFHAIAAEFHPDRHFRKRLGSYKPKIEAIFTRITLAHDVLVSVRRAAYDENLARLRGTTRPQAAPAPAPVPEAAPRPDARPRGFDQEALRPRRRSLAQKLSGTYARITPATREEPPVPEPDPEWA